jgi:hypothetical protein
MRRTIIVFALVVMFVALGARAHRRTISTMLAGTTGALIVAAALWPRRSGGGQ